MSMLFCPHCHQPMPREVIAGVSLPPLKADLFNYILRHPGLNSMELAEHVYGDSVPQANTVRSHIYQINDALMDTGVRIQGDKLLGYHITGSSAA